MLQFQIERKTKGIAVIFNAVFELAELQIQSMLSLLLFGQDESFLPFVVIPLFVFHHFVFLLFELADRQVLKQL